MKSILDDHRFRVGNSALPDRLVRSIRRIGLVHPPVVVRRRNRWVLLSGWRRIQACRALGLASIPVSVLSEPDDGRALLFAVEENAAARELSLLEKADILRKLRAWKFSGARLRKRILPLRDSPDSRPSRAVPRRCPSRSRDAGFRWDQGYPGGRGPPPVRVQASRPQSLDSHPLSARTEQADRNPRRPQGCRPEEARLAPEDPGVRFDPSRSRESLMASNPKIGAGPPDSQRDASIPE